MSESKSEGKDAGESKEGSTNRVLELVEQFCMSNSMEAEFDAFAAEHAEVFVRCLEIDRGGVEEHPLEFHDIYTKYLKIFEAKIESFIVSKGFAVKDFYLQCQEVTYFFPIQIIYVTCSSFPLLFSFNRSCGILGRLLIKILCMARLVSLSKHYLRQRSTKCFMS